MSSPVERSVDKIVAEIGLIIEAMKKKSDTKKVNKLLGEIKNLVKKIEKEGCNGCN